MYTRPSRREAAPFRQGYGTVEGREPLAAGMVIGPDEDMVLWHFLLHP